MGKPIRSYKSVLKQLTTAPHYFALLGVHAGSTDAEVGKARNALARYVHPDVNSAPNAHDLMALLNVAHSVLTTNRELYVVSLRQKGLKPCTPCKGDGFVRKQVGFTKTTKTQCPNCQGSGLSE